MGRDQPFLGMRMRVDRMRTYFQPRSKIMALIKNNRSRGFRLVGSRQSRVFLRPLMTLKCVLKCHLVNQQGKHEGIEVRDNDQSRYVGQGVRNGSFIHQYSNRPEISRS